MDKLKSRRKNLFKQEVEKNIKSFLNCNQISVIESIILMKSWKYSIIIIS